MGSRETKADWWRVDPPEHETPFWIHGHVSFRDEAGFVGLLLGFSNEEGMGSWSPPTRPGTNPH